MMIAKFLKELRTNRDTQALFVLFALTIFTFHRAFFASFVYWDDDVFILRNEILKMDIWDALRTSFSSYFHGDFLPLTLLSYWFDTQIFGFNWSAIHAINIGFHLANITLLYWFLLRFTKSWEWTVFICLMFAIHPLQAEPVVWISERKSLISGMFTLGALVLYLKYIETGSKRTFAWSMVNYVASILAKTTSILLPVLFFVLDVFYGKKSLKVAILRLIPSIILIGVVAVLRTISYDNSTPGVVAAMWDPARLQEIPFMAFYAILFYIQKFFWPEHLSSAYDFYSATPAYRMGALWGLGLISGYLIWIWRKRSAQGLFFFLVFFLFLLPVLQIVPRANYLNDRYMYLPVIGLAGMVLFVWQELAKKFQFQLEATVRMALMVLVVPMGAIALQQSRIWETNLVFWEHTVEHNPLNILARNALGLEYHERRRYEEAIQQYDVVMRQIQVPMALKLKAVNNLANVYTDTRYPNRNLAKAAELYEMAIRSAERPNMTYELRINLAQTYYQMDKKGQASFLVNQVYKELKSDPDSRNIWLIPFIERMISGPPAQVGQPQQTTP